MKDPAFLFYSKDFYEGTRMMLPEERACYVDLLIYQHQNGAIPDDRKRLLMYCSGVDEATLEATLEAKFKKTEVGWVNHRLNIAVDNRENYKKGQSLSGKIGQFWKKSKQLLSEIEFSNLKQLANKEEVILFLDNNEAIELETLKGWFKHRLNNKVNANANGIIDVKGKEGKGGKPNFNYRIALISITQDTQLVDDYIALRKLKKAPQTKTAFDSLMKECIDNGFDINEALKICIEKNWQGFKVQWVLNDRANTSVNNTSAGAIKTQPNKFIGRMTEEDVKNNLEGW